MLVSGGPRSRPPVRALRSRARSIAASTSTFGSLALAVSIASCSPAMSAALDVPMLEPAPGRLHEQRPAELGDRVEHALRSGLADSPSARAVPAGQSPLPDDHVRPTGRPRALKIIFMYSLSC